MEDNRSKFIQVEGISFSYPGGDRLLENISFDMEWGNCLGITGRSGGGKSTLAQIISGHIPPDRGRIMLDGQDVTGKPSRDVFLVHQDSDLFPWLTVERQIAYGMKVADSNEVKRLIKMTKLDGFQRYYPYQLSGGMKKRLSIARALAVNPKLLIFDESFSSLDIDLRLELFADLKSIWQKTGATILLITHDPRDIQGIAQRELKVPDSFTV